VQAKRLEDLRKLSKHSLNSDGAVQQVSTSNVRSNIEGEVQIPLKHEEVVEKLEWTATNNESGAEGVTVMTRSWSRSTNRHKALYKINFNNIKFVNFVDIESAYLGTYAHWLYHADSQSSISKFYFSSIHDIQVYYPISLESFHCIVSICESKKEIVSRSQCLIFILQCSIIIYKADDIIWALYDSCAWQNSTQSSHIFSK